MDGLPLRSHLIRPVGGGLNIEVSLIKVFQWGSTERLRVVGSLGPAAGLLTGSKKRHSGACRGDVGACRGRPGVCEEGNIGGSAGPISGASPASTQNQDYTANEETVH